MQLRNAYWVPAFAVSALVHVAAAGVWPQSPPGTVDERAAGDLDRIAITGSLSDAMGKPQLLDAVEADVPEQEWQDASEVAEVTDTVVQRPVDGAIAPEASAQATVSPAEPAPVEPVPSDTVEVAASPTEVQAPVEPPVSKPAGQAKPVDPLVAEPVRQPLKQKERPANKQATKQKPSQTSQQGTSRQASKAGRGEAVTRAGTGGRSATAAGRAMLSSYLGRVASSVQRQKRYPPAARRARAAGTAVVVFVITQSGAVSGIRLNRGSGHASLDQEVLAMVRRAGPFPPIPTDVGKSRLSLSIPVRFSIQ